MGKSLSKILLQSRGDKRLTDEHRFVTKRTAPFEEWAHPP